MAARGDGQCVLDLLDEIGRIGACLADLHPRLERREGSAPRDRLSIIQPVNGPPEGGVLLRLLPPVDQRSNHLRDVELPEVRNNHEIALIHLADEAPQLAGNGAGVSVARIFGVVRLLDDLSELPIVEAQVHEPLGLRPANADLIRRQCLRHAIDATRRDPQNERAHSFLQRRGLPRPGLEGSRSSTSFLPSSDSVIETA